MKNTSFLFILGCCIATVLLAEEMSPLWVYDNHKGILSTPLIYNGKLYLTARNANASNEGAIYEFAADTGHLQRTIPFPKDGQNSPYSGFSSPVIVNGMLLHAWESIQAFDLATGQRKWCVTDTGRIYGTPVIADGKIIFAGKQKLYALDYDGKQLWAVDIGAECAARMATDGERVFIGDQNGVCHAYDVKDGHEIWRFATEKTVRAKPCIYLGLVVFCSFDGSINALDKKTGEIRWRLFTRRMIFGDPALEGNILYVSDAAGKLRAYDVMTGICRYETTLPDWGSSSITVSNGKIYLGDYAGNAMILNAANGSLERKFAFRDWIRSAPAIYQNMVYFASMDGCLAAFQK